MITNFEDITSDLSPAELLLVPVIANSMKKYNKENPITANEIISRFNDSKQYSTLLTGPRLRKIVNYIRCKSIVPLIATSDGYYISDDIDEIKKQIESLTQRANSIMECAAGLQQLIK